MVDIAVCRLFCVMIVRRRATQGVDEPGDGGSSAGIYSAGAGGMVWQGERRSGYGTV